MENGGKGTQRIGAWHTHLTHDIHHDGTGLTQRGLDLRTLIIAAQFAADLGLGGIDAQSTDTDRSELGHRDIAIGTDRELQALLRGTIDIDDQLIARTHHIVLGRGDVHLRLK